MTARRRSRPVRPDRRRAMVATITTAIIMMAITTTITMALRRDQDTDRRISTMTSAGTWLWPATSGPRVLWAAAGSTAWSELWTRAGVLWAATGTTSGKLRRVHVAPTGRRAAVFWTVGSAAGHAARAWTVFVRTAVEPASYAALSRSGNTVS